MSPVKRKSIIEPNVESHEARTKTTMRNTVSLILNSNIHHSNLEY